MIKHLVIAGGGTAGWMTAAAFCHFFKGSDLKITLIESEEIGSVGVGEATIPHIRVFNEKIGIDEHEFMRECNATFKLGIEFAGWKEIGHSYIHPFGSVIAEFNEAPLHHYWARARKLGLKENIDLFCIATQMANHGRFTYPAKSASPLTSQFSYAFHIDANKYAQLLRRKCEKKYTNFNRIEGKIEQVIAAMGAPRIEKLKLNDGSTIEGDFFIDCSGFRSLLLEKTLGAKEISFSEHLPCDSAIAAPTDDIHIDMPFSRATAHTAGWQWKIPLRHRTGNGCVYSSKFMSDDQAQDQFRQGLTGKPLAEPKIIRFKARRMSHSWIGNCAGVGLSSGFLEPLESTGLHFIQTAIMKLTELLPHSADFAPERDEFNRQMRNEYEKARDFIVLHYRITERDDSEFWKYIRQMPLPETLEQRINLIKEHGVFDSYQHGLFLESSWAGVYYGQGGPTEAKFHRTFSLNDQPLTTELRRYEAEVSALAKGVPPQKEILDRIHEGTEQQAWPPAAMSLYGVFS